MVHPVYKLDFSHLRELTGEDPDFMIEILDMIREQSPGVLTEMQDLLAQDAFQPLASVAHKYKSSINVLGSDTVNALVRDIENTAKRNPNHQQLDQLLKDFEEACDVMLNQIQSELDTLKAVS